MHDSPTCNIREICDHIQSCLEKNWGFAADQLPYESAEGGYQGLTWDTYDLLVDEIGLDLPRDSRRVLFGELLERLTDQTWCEYDWGTLDRDVALRTSWERFCETIKHKRRFFFHGEGRDDRDSYTAASLLNAIAQIGETMGLIRDLQPGTRLWRARPDMQRGQHGSPSDFGPPPVQFALQSNRMNPPGIPMFYVASTAQTALLETRAAEARIGQWRVDRVLRVFDLRRMPSTPGIFSDAPRNHRLALRFLHLFARDIMTPVARDQRVHVDYLPSQVVTEFVRDYPFGSGKVDGIAYGSTVHSGWNVALFLGPVELGLAKPEWGPTPTPWVSFQKAIRLTDGPNADSGPE